MTELFVPYNEALELKQLGFDEPCLASIRKDRNFPYIPSKGGLFSNHLFNNDFAVPCPLHSQSFRFFREKYKLFCETRTSVVVKENRLTFSGWVINLHKGEPIGEYAGSGETYEEVELACLRKLIELCKEKNG